MGQTPKLRKSFSQPYGRDDPQNRPVKSSSFLSSVVFVAKVMMLKNIQNIQNYLSRSLPLEARLFTLLCKFSMHHSNFHPCIHYFKCFFLYPLLHLITHNHDHLLSFQNLENISLGYGLNNREKCFSLSFTVISILFNYNFCFILFLH